MSGDLILVSNPTVEALEPIRIRLQQADYTIQVARDEQAALDLLKNQTPKGILIDIATPELKGVELCSILREAAGANVVLIAINQGEGALRQAALNAGADLVLDEPVNWADLRHWLESPRGSTGQLMAEGALLGQTPADSIGAAALLSHDLKSPISVIISSLEVMLSFQESDDESDPTHRLLRGALNAAYRQLNLVSTLVDLSRLELGCYELQLAEYDLVEVVRDGLGKEAYNLKVKALDVQTDLPDTPIMAQVDAELIQRVIASLIDNAMKFTVRADHLHIQLAHEGDQAVLRFTDSGRPIQPGFEQDIMRRAPQWERRQSGARTSVALGLPFAYAVALAHKGSFTAATPDGKRTTFTFSVPAL